MTDSKETQFSFQLKDSKFETKEMIYFYRMKVTYRIHAVESYWDKYLVWIWKLDGSFYDC